MKGLKNLMMQDGMHHIEIGLILIINGYRHEKVNHDGYVFGACSAFDDATVECFSSRTGRNFRPVHFSRC